MQKQNETIWKSEADAWYRRNSEAPYSAEIISAFKFLHDSFLGQRDGLNVLEFGCSDGRNGRALEKFQINYTGVDPSDLAVQEGIARGLNLRRGMAQTTSFPKQFDLIILGFFLYLTPKTDWMGIVKNIDDHIGETGYIIIKDFFSESYAEKNYSHDDNLKMHKFNFSKMFSWYPDYTEIYKSMTSTEPGEYSSNDYFVQTTVLKVSRNG